MTDKKTNHFTRAFWLRLGVISLSFLLTLACFEIVLRFLPVQSYVPYQPVNSDSPVARYRPYHQFVYSGHWNFQDTNYGRTNAQGFVSDFDYNTADQRPLIAVIGDSYIEARMVQFSQTIQEKIRLGLGDAVRVYTFAMNGAALSQYLAFAKMARDTYHPNMLVVNIVSNDFDESFSQYQTVTRFHYFIQDAQGNLQPRLRHFYRPSWLRELFSHSALVRYAYFHLHVTDIPRKTKRLWHSLSDTLRSKNSPAALNPSQDKKKEIIEVSQQAVDAFLRLLPEYAGLPPGSIVLVLDGQRRALYRGPHKLDARFEHMRRYISQRASLMGYELIDMHPVFKTDFQAHRKRFEFSYDAHWNARAHGLAASAVLKSRTLKRHFKNDWR